MSKPADAIRRKIEANLDSVLKQRGIFDSAIAEARGRDKKIALLTQALAVERVMCDMVRGMAATDAQIKSDMEAIIRTQAKMLLKFGVEVASPLDDLDTPTTH